MATIGRRGAEPGDPRGRWRNSLSPCPKSDAIAETLLGQPATAAGALATAPGCDSSVATKGAPLEESGGEAILRNGCDHDTRWVARDPGRNLVRQQPLADLR